MLDIKHNIQVAMFLSISKLIPHRACLLQNVESILSSQRENPLTVKSEYMVKKFLKIFHLLKKDIMYLLQSKNTQLKQCFTILAKVSIVKK